MSAPGNSSAVSGVVQGRAPSALRRAIHWRCFHCGATFTKAQERHARDHFGRNEDALPVCQMRVPGEYHLLNILRKQEAELRAFYAEDTELWRALYAQAADHAQALRQEEERGYAKGLADARAEATTLGPSAAATSTRPTMLREEQSK